ncbi:unnamed protein product [Ilex paraguariensis]|uniref:Uncharacterized protein n=2 Tax=Ilex paraguariensis TaxID=185542 RepID=A0ABC8SIP9_9AQUA
MLQKNHNSFTKAKIICNHSDLKYDDKKFGVVFGVNHGVSIMLVGSINVFAMYSASNSKIWVFSVKIMDNEEDGVNMKLIKCALIDCTVPVFSISISFGFLVLGEVNGVRVFPLRPLVKGKVKKTRRVCKNFNVGLDTGEFDGQRLNLPNGVAREVNGSDEFDNNSKDCTNCGVVGRGTRSIAPEGTVEVSSNGHREKKIDKQGVVSKNFG